MKPRIACNRWIQLRGLFVIQWLFFLVVKSLQWVLSRQIGRKGGTRLKAISRPHRTGQKRSWSTSTWTKRKSPPSPRGLNFILAKKAWFTNKNPQQPHGAFIGSRAAALEASSRRVDTAELRLTPLVWRGGELWICHADKPSPCALQIFASSRLFTHISPLSVSRHHNW